MHQKGNQMPSAPRTPKAAGLGHRARTSGAIAAAGLVGALGLSLMAASPVLAATGSGTATGTSQVVGYRGPVCGVTESLTFVATGSATYSATMGRRTATYSGPVQLALQKTPRLGYTGPFGTKGYSCSNPPGTPFDATATTTGSDSSGSLSCTYTGTIGRVNPLLGNGTDLATAVLSGTCTIRQGDLVVSDSPTAELRIINYVLNSCTGGPAPNFACHNDTTFTATNLVTGTHTGPLLIGPGSTLISGATIHGPVVIEAGASVSIQGSQLYGPIRATRAASLSVCGTHVRGGVLVTGSSGFVRVGAAGDDGPPACGPNTVSGPLVLARNAGGVEVSANTVTGAVRLVANTGAGPGAENAAPELEANHVDGPLVCVANVPAPTDDGQANFVNGPAAGQCSGLVGPRQRMG